MIMEQTLELGVEIIREEAALGTQLQNVGKSLVEFLEIGPDLGFGSAQPRVEFGGQRAQQTFIRSGMQPANAGDFGSVFNQTHGAPRSIYFLEEHADVDPFVADKIRRIAQDAKAKHIPRFVRHVSLPVGKRLSR